MSGAREIDAADDADEMPVRIEHREDAQTLRVEARGRVVNGIFEGQYTDKYQTGLFHFDMSSAH